MATPSARPICRDMFRTPKPVANRLAGEHARGEAEERRLGEADADRADEHPRQEVRHVPGRGVDPRRPPRAAGGEAAGSPTVATGARRSAGRACGTWTDTTATVAGRREIMSPAMTMLSPHGAGEAAARCRAASRRSPRRTAASTRWRGRTAAPAAAAARRPGWDAGRTARGRRRAARGRRGRRRERRAPAPGRALDDAQDEPADAGDEQHDPQQVRQPPLVGVAHLSSTRRDATTAPAPSGRLTRKIGASRPRRARRRAAARSRPRSRPRTPRRPRCRRAPRGGNAGSRRPSDVG